MEQTVTLHLEKFVTVLRLLDTALELDEFAAGWFNVQVPSISPPSSWFTVVRSLAVVGMVLVDPLLVEADKVLGVN